MSVVDCPASMSLVESEAAFFQRCDEVAPGLKGLLEAKGIKSFRKLAFAVGTPQSAPNETEFHDLAVEIYGAEPSISQIADLRTLHFESTAFVVAVLKEHVSGSDGPEGLPSLKRIPAAERRARLLAQQRRLRGLSIEGELCPSFALCDLANTIYETSVMQWVSPSKCSKRDTELQSVSKHDARSAISLEKQSLVVVPHEGPKTDTSTELRLQWAFMRRGIAFDQCHLLSWEIHQKWVTLLMEALCESPPPGYSAVTAAQIVRADREIWTLLARDLPGPYKVTATGVSPCDAVFERLMTHARITQFLLPLRGSAAKGATTAREATRDLGDSGGSTSTKPPARPKKKAKPQPKKAAKPPSLKNYSCKHSSGKPICWAYNCAEGCTLDANNNVVPGIPGCRKGLHCCCKCFRANHGLVSCRSKE